MILEYRRYLLLALAVFIIGILLWYFLQSRLVGDIAVSVINVDGTVGAQIIHLSDFAIADVPNPFDETSRVLAAVPSPDGAHLAFLSLTRDGIRHVSLWSGEGAPIPVFDGINEAPSWSADSKSIAFASLTTSTSSQSAGNPDSWRAMRAVLNGASLQVGTGFRPYPSSKQGTFALTSAGIALLSYREATPRIVVESPAPVLTSTPFAVSTDGMRVAWVAPADRSLQVFENQNGFFVPVLLKSDYQPTSIAFSPDGAYLIGAVITDATSTISAIAVNGGAVRTLGTLAGRAKILSWNYAH